MVQFYDYLSYLPPEWETFMLMKLANVENLQIPEDIIKSVQKSLYMVKRQNSKENLTFKPYHGTLAVKYDDQNRAVVSKTGGGWWQNIVSDQQILGVERINFKLNSCGDKYVGIGFGVKDYEQDESFLGQRNDGWSLCTASDYEWDGHIFNGITTNTGKPYAPGQLLRPGATITLEIDTIKGVATWIVGEKSLGVAWYNVTRQDLHVIVSMYMPNSSVTVWRD